MITRMVNDVEDVHVNGGAGGCDEEENELGEESDGKSGVGAAWLTLFSSALVGTQLAWALQISFASPIFLDMGATRRTLGLLRVPGPATGLLTQPIVGTLIDIERRAAAMTSATTTSTTNAAMAPESTSALLGGDSSSSSMTSSTSLHHHHPHQQQQQQRRRGGRRWLARLPFSVWCLIGGSTCCFSGLILMAAGRRVGVVFGDATRGIVTASIGLWLTDFGFNAADVAMRAVAVDALPTSAQPAANGAIAGAMGTGQVLGFVLGSLPMGRLLFGSAGHASDFEGDVVVALVIIMLTLVGSVTALTSSVCAGTSGDFMNVFERQQQRRRRQTQREQAARCGGPGSRRRTAQVSNGTYTAGAEGNGINGMYAANGMNGHEHCHAEDECGENGDDDSRCLLTPADGDDDSASAAATTGAEHEALKGERPRVALVASSFNLFRCPTQFYDIALVTFFMWLGWFPFLYQCTDFVGSTIFGGDPAGSEHEEEVYARGVRFANLWLAANAVIVIASSRTIVPLAASRHGGYTLAAGAGVLAVLLVVLAHLRHGALAATAVVLALLGMPWAVTGSQPYALLAMHCEADAASLMGKLNICVVAPSFCVLLAMYCLTPLGVDARVLILLGGCFAAAAMCAAVMRLRALR